MTKALLHLKNNENSVQEKFSLNAGNVPVNTYVDGVFVRMTHGKLPDGLLVISVGDNQHEFKPQTEIKLRIGPNYFLIGTHT